MLSKDKVTLTLQLIIDFYLCFAVTFLFPHRPNVHRIGQVGLNWIYLSWDQNSAQDNVLKYEVKFSFIGENPRASPGGMFVVVNSRTSFNITGLEEHSSYSINLTAINDKGRSPPNIAFAVTRPEGI